MIFNDLEAVRYYVLGCPVFKPEHPSMSLKIFDNDELLTEDEARVEVGIKCTRTLRRWRDLRQGPPFVRIGRRVYYRRGALRQWLLAREKAA
jgi:hypothetical protein